MLKIMAIGDVVGEAGLEMLGKHLHSLKKTYAVDFVIANGENAAGVGLLPRHAEEMFNAGVDVITLGNHSFDKREIYGYLDDSPYILRPHNYSPSRPGRGYGIYDCGRTKLAVVNLMGRLNMNELSLESPFTMIQELLPVLKKETNIIIVDLHAEATSEALAFSYSVDGSVSGVFGTHTHVPTADERILPKGTGHITDAGMTGPLESVLGIEPGQSVDFFLGRMPSRYRTASGRNKLDAVIFSVDTDSGLCAGIERLNILD